MTYLVTDSQKKLYQTIETSSRLDGIENDHIIDTFQFLTSTS
jgi:hypothetical protein